MRAVLWDYDAGNLHSLGRALAAVGFDVDVVGDPVRASRAADLLVLPGVGAFGPAAARVATGRETLRDALRAGQPCIGICLGMQLLFDSSEEGLGAGIGWIEGRVNRLVARRLPHMGWTPVDGLGEMYFAHAYACVPRDPSLAFAWASHEERPFVAAVRKGRTIGVQFHPEKSSAAGLSLLAALCGEVTS